MPLSVAERKHRLEHGTQKRLASRFRISTAYVSSIVNGDQIPQTRKGWKRYARVQEAIARELGMTREEAFSDEERGLNAQEMAAA